MGGGIVEILQRKKAYLRELTGTDMSIKTICVKNLSKPRDFTVPDDCKITDNYDDILNDKDIDMVVEVMGGTTDAKDVVFKALKQGKDVVTANKALISKYLPEIEKLLAECNKGKDRDGEVEFRYEAAVWRYPSDPLHAV